MTTKRWIAVIGVGVASCGAPYCPKELHLGGRYELVQPTRQERLDRGLGWMSETTLEVSPDEAEIWVEVVVEDKRYRAVYTYEAVDPGYR